jgi:hypothetical protein
LTPLENDSKITFAKPSQAKPSQAKPSQAKQMRDTQRGGVVDVELVSPMILENSVNCEPDITTTSYYPLSISHWHYHWHYHCH